MELNVQHYAGKNIFQVNIFLTKLMTADAITAPYLRAYTNTGVSLTHSASCLLTISTSDTAGSIA